MTTCKLVRCRLVKSLTDYAEKTSEILSLIYFNDLNSILLFSHYSEISFSVLITQKFSASKSIPFPLIEQQVLELQTFTPPLQHIGI